jgi:YesN/AraC family two-component response regulator
MNFKKKYNILTAPDGIQGLKALENNPDIRVVVSDMRMPYMNGIEFIKKAHDKYPDKKFYILTGFEITNEIKEALKSKQILKYFSKPFNMNDIDTAITEAIDLE